jgi:hypothetical protein
MLLHRRLKLFILLLESEAWGLNPPFRDITNLRYM